MNPALHYLTLASAGASGALFSAIWEGAALAAAVVICLRLLPGLSAAARSVIWLNTFVLLVLLHFVPAFAPHAKPLSDGSVSALHVNWLWSLGVVVLWAGLSLWRMVQLAHGALHLFRLARRATPVANIDPELAAILNSGGRTAQLCVSSEVARPSILGFFRPRVLLPEGIREALSPEELRHVVLHEMEHLHRADDWTNLLQKIGLLLFPLNPVLLWVERRLCAERELACDDRVIHSTAGRKAYALCLTHLAEFSLLRRSFSLVLGAFERRSELVRRIHRILQQPGRTMSRKAAYVATGSLVTGALGCALVLANSPQLVTFTPAAEASHQVSALATAAALDPHAVSRALGGTPQLVKASVPNPAAAQRTTPPAHRAVNRRQPHRAAPSLIASAAWTPGQNLPANLGQQSTTVVLTEFRSAEQAPRVVLALAADQRTSPATAKAVAIPARYAVVRLPDGWLIIQI